MLHQSWRRFAGVGLSIAGLLGVVALEWSAVAVAAPAPRATTPPAAAVLASPAAAGLGYRLQPGDILRVAVWQEKDLRSDVLIRPDGGISFPLAGELHAAGHTVGELITMLEQRIRKYVPDALVTVAVKSTAGNRVFVIGKVQRPGDFLLIGPLDVLQALSLAGGGTPFANMNDIRILRRAGNHQISIPFRYGDVERGRRLDQNILLQSGDTVVVP